VDLWEKKVYGEKLLQSQEKNYKAKFLTGLILKK
jgi:hypothetical protein